MLILTVVLTAVVLSGVCLVVAYAAAVVWAIQKVRKLVSSLKRAVERLQDDVPMLKTVVHVLQALLMVGFGLGVVLFKSENAPGQLLIGVAWMFVAASGIYRAERRIKQIEDKEKFK
ncbi:hypothetical protein ACFQNJ_17220 [Hydrogenophaga bisanensis]|uniref:Uncharacterized protein n=1 Tax=Hydrogenophaga bisanensis TaxID=439611 RepID=A0ABW2RDQ7_9BURK